jgi:hypothetical protein
MKRWDKSGYITVLRLSTMQTTLMPGAQKNQPTSTSDRLIFFDGFKPLPTPGATHSD